MLSLDKNVITVLVAVSMVGAAIVGSTTVGADEVEKERSNGLRIIVAEQTDPIAATKLVLRVTYENVSKHSFSLPDFRGKFVKVIDANGKAVEPGPGPKLPTGRARPVVVLEPGESNEQKQYLICTQPSGSKVIVGWSYKLKPGTYRFSVIAENPHVGQGNQTAKAWKGKAVSNEVAIVIK